MTEEQSRQRLEDIVGLRRSRAGASAAMFRRRTHLEIHSRPGDASLESLLQLQGDIYSHIMLSFKGTGACHTKDPIHTR